MINACFGGFSLSNKGIKRYLELKGKKCYFYKNDFKIKIFEKTGEKNNVFLNYIFTKNFGDKFKDAEFISGGPQNKKYKAIWDYHFSGGDISRDDEHLIQVVEELGEEANGECAKLEIVEIPNGVDWEKDEYDGIESVEEAHRSWN